MEEEIETTNLRKPHSSYDTLTIWAINKRKIGKEIAFTNGCFDGLHLGHVHMLYAAASHGSCLIVGVNCDSVVRKLKGDNRPKYLSELRCNAVGLIQCVDLAMKFMEDTPLEMIKAIKPDVLVKGDEYTEEEIVGAEFVRSYGGRVVRVPMLSGHSTGGCE